MVPIITPFGGENVGMVGSFVCRGRGAKVAIRIPEPFKRGLLALANMPEASYRALSAALSRAPQTFAMIQELVVWTTPEVPDASPEEIEEIVEALVSLYRISQRADVASVNQLVQDVASSLPISKLEDSTRATFEERLSSLLASKSLNVLEAKARELKMQDERLMIEARVVTDLRPVFDKEIGDASLGMIITHSLKIRFVESGSDMYRDMYFAMDADDIRNLKTAIERAERKINALKNSLGAAQIRIVDLE